MKSKFVFAQKCPGQLLLLSRGQSSIHDHFRWGNVPNHNSSSDIVAGKSFPRLKRALNSLSRFTRLLVEVEGFDCSTKNINKKYDVFINLSCFFLISRGKMLVLFLVLWGKMLPTVEQGRKFTFHIQRESKIHVERPDSLTKNVNKRGHRRKNERTKKKQAKKPVKKSLSAEIRNF